MSLSRLEQETVFTYNQEEKDASIYTFDPSLMRKLDKMCGTSEEIKLKKEGNGFKEYILPKKWIKVHMPKQLSEEARQRLIERGRIMAQRRLNQN